MQGKLFQWTKAQLVMTLQLSGPAMSWSNPSTETLAYFLSTKFDLFQKMFNLKSTLVLIVKLS